ncbi:class I SAM-dependent methyltransferase [Paraflavitalea pollutisoli]|uniref:class I SAM-dependent methyltransferase n=1 Tax=Paraflavitalea pollutisoli TaxID=3034143 RepID=UPI0023EBC35E|nr:class I SAM-dependent methyltransferase [Paraflavitalea sp. H1-2-19X]
MRTLILLLVLSLPALVWGQKRTAVPVNQLVQGRLDTIVSLLQLTPQDVVADIGSGNGKNLVRLSAYYPPMRYHVEDIDSSTCNRRTFSKMIKAYNPAISIDSFTFHYGTPTATNLPKQYFTKILMIAVLHEFDSRDEMLADIKSILQPGGLIYFEEPLTTTPRPVEKGCRNPYLTEAAFREILQRNRIEIIREKPIPDAGDGQRYRKFFQCKVGA